MKEKIISIENESFKIDNCYYDGFIIHTNEQLIKIGISSGQSCCERYGCIITNDEIYDFIGSNLLNVSITDTELGNKKIEEGIYEGGCMFVNIDTSNGILQFVAYNSHNGYYGHDAVLVSKQLIHNERL